MAGKGGVGAADGDKLLPTSSEDDGADNGGLKTGRRTRKHKKIPDYHGLDDDDQDDEPEAEFDDVEEDDDDEGLVHDDDEEVIVSKLTRNRRKKGGSSTRSSRRIGRIQGSGSVAGGASASAATTKVTVSSTAMSPGMEKTRRKKMLTATHSLQRGLKGGAAPVTSRKKRGSNSNNNSLTEFAAPSKLKGSSSNSNSNSNSIPAAPKRKRPVRKVVAAAAALVPDGIFDNPSDDDEDDDEEEYHPASGSFPSAPSGFAKRSSSSSLPGDASRRATSASVASELKRGVTTGALESGGSGNDATLRRSSARRGAPSVAAALTSTGSGKSEGGTQQRIPKKKPPSLNLSSGGTSVTVSTLSLPKLPFSAQSSLQRSSSTSSQGNKPRATSVGLEKSAKKEDAIPRKRRLSIEGASKDGGNTSDGPPAAAAAAHERKKDGSAVDSSSNKKLKVDSSREQKPDNTRDGASSSNSNSSKHSNKITNHFIKASSKNNHSNKTTTHLEDKASSLPREKKRMGRPPNSSRKNSNAEKRSSRQDAPAPSLRSSNRIQNKAGSEREPKGKDAGGEPKGKDVSASDKLSRPGGRLSPRFSSSPKSSDEKERASRASPNQTKTPLVVASGGRAAPVAGIVQKKVEHAKPKAVIKAVPSKEEEEEKLFSDDEEDLPLSSLAAKVRTSTVGRATVTTMTSIAVPVVPQNMDAATTAATEAAAEALTASFGISSPASSPAAAIKKPNANEASKKDVSSKADVSASEIVLDAKVVVQESGEANPTAASSSSPALKKSPAPAATPEKPKSSVLITAAGIQIETDEAVHARNPLILVGDKPKNVYECDYCRRDISQIPRIRCAICPEFDLCLDCFATTIPDDEGPVVADGALSSPDKATPKRRKRGEEVGGAASPTSGKKPEKIKKETKGAEGSVVEAVKMVHAPSHGYRVADSTRFPLFPVTKAVLSAKDILKRRLEEKPNPAAPTTEASTDLPLTAVTDTRTVWTAEEDLRLLDAIRTHGLGNWCDISEAVSGTVAGVPIKETREGGVKNAKRCMERYMDDYLGRFGHIVPPFLAVDVPDDAPPKEEEDTDGPGKDAMDEDATDQEKPNPPKQQKPTEDSWPRTKKMVVATESLADYAQLWPNPYIPPLPRAAKSKPVQRDVIFRAEQAAAKALTANDTDEIARINKSLIQQDIHTPLVLPPRLDDICHMKGSECAGYMPRRGDFDVEYDPEAETLVADMEFSSSDTPSERELKLQVIQIYNARLSERERRKTFLLERDLLDYRGNQARDAQRDPEERDLIQRMRLFARFHTPKEHTAFLETVLQAKRLRKEIAQLQRYRMMGFESLAECEMYEMDKRRREYHASAKRLSDQENEMNQVPEPALSAAQVELLRPKYAPENRTTARKRRRKEPDGDANKTTDKGIRGKQITPKTDATNPTLPAEPDITTQPQYPLLSSQEVLLCEAMEMTPKQYLEAKRGLIQESLTGGLLQSSPSPEQEKELPTPKPPPEAIYKLDVEKRNGVIDFVLRAGWIAAKPNYAQ
eukprot:CAMPEP_0194399308 /NCGR_PEP_ID=MMETSP0174-20130528/126589_1 /TAXON_ID=216777 /ORGANISM="Proboscia alata, Strain PI-D3" /LENGTH=1523 /DNA_ID=CAMNT_0039195705 /DNA_START=124 /DNA_END=4695 /DNA_ORIENTATION=-